MKKAVFYLMGSLAAVIGIASCNNDNSTTPPGASFGVINASPDAGNIDVYLGGSVAAQNFAYGADTGYFAVVPGTYFLQMAKADSSNFLVNSNVDFAPGIRYSVFAIDTVRSLQAAVVEDNFTTPSTDSVRIRFFHFSPGTPAVDVAVAGGAVLFANRSFNDQATNSAYAQFSTLAAGTYNLNVLDAGTSTVALSVPNVVLEGGKIYTLYAKGLINGDGAEALGVGTVIHNQ